MIEESLQTIETKLNPYLEDFDARAEDKAFIVGNVTEKAAKERELLIMKQQAAHELFDAAMYRHEMQTIVKAERAAIDRAEQGKVDIKKQCREVEDAMQLRDRIRTEKLNHGFRIAERQLTEALQERKRQVRERYGPLRTHHRTVARLETMGQRISKMAQPIKIHLGRFRAVKDKLPPGQYIVMGSMYNRLGGQCLPWSTMSAQRWCGSTIPIKHKGRHTDIDLSVNQNIFTCCPGRAHLRPNTVFIFELVLLRGTIVPVDTVVCWGALPVSDAKFDVVKGKYKIPMLTGPVLSIVEKYSEIETLMQSHIDNWMCNLYLEVTHLPKFIHDKQRQENRRETEVRMEATSELLFHPDRADESEPDEDYEMRRLHVILDDEELLDAEEAAPTTRSKPVGTSASIIEGADDARFVTTHDDGADRLVILRDSGRPGTTGTEETEATTGSFHTAPEPREPLLEELETVDLHPEEDDAVPPTPTPGMHLDLRLVDGGSNPFVMPRGASSAERPETASEPSTRQSDREEEDEEEADAEEDASGEEEEADPFVDLQEVENDRVAALKKTPVELLVPEPGKRFTVHTHGITDLAFPSDFPTPPAICPRDGKRSHHVLPQTQAQQLEEFQTSLHTPESIRDRSISFRKALYLWRIVLQDFGFHSPASFKTATPYLTLFFFVLSYYLITFAHYFGQYLLLRCAGVAIVRFAFTGATMVVTYIAALLPFLVELLVVLAGPAANLAMFLLYYIAAAAVRRLFRRLPDSLSRFLLVHAIMVVLDPLVIMVVDLIRGNMQGDIFKLPNSYTRTEGGGGAGVALLILFYSCYFALAFFAVYHYLIRLYMNGCLPDLYRRLHDDDNTFFVPHDLEISISQLRRICERAERWRGKDGSRRKCKVVDYIHEDPRYPDWKDVTTHISIAQLKPGTPPVLYRHFLRLPSGALVEVFGDLDSLGSTEYNAVVSLSGVTGVESFLREVDVLTGKALPDIPEKPFEYFRVDGLPEAARDDGRMLLDHPIAPNLAFPRPGDRRA
eukprot:gnl/Trimastix_PCT/1372.p1 GENE.gnl/Trimastix_PCT/1372~~gnl/Trimastix_PCT/1372.p1  ORF type:complete len:1018 (+),score=358.49 gnl/Trimastix_PCT/1372:100-3153(+)